MKILGIDYGDKRIGLALSDDLGIVASPLRTLNIKSLSDAVTKIHKIADSLRIDLLVVGLPLNDRRQETQQSIQTRYFANALGETNGEKVVFWNEAFSSMEAVSSLRLGSTRKKKNLDSEAARIILQGYLDNEHDKSDNRGLLNNFDTSLRVN